MTCILDGWRGRSLLNTLFDTRLNHGLERVISDYARN